MGILITQSESEATANRGENRKKSIFLEP